MDKNAVKKFSANNKESNMDKPSLFARIGRWFKKTFSSKKAGVAARKRNSLRHKLAQGRSAIRRAYDRVVETVRPVTNALTRAWNYVMPPLVGIVHITTILLGIGIYVVCFAVNPISTIAFTFIGLGGLLTWGTIAYVCENSENESAKYVAKVMATITRVVGITLEVAGGLLVLATMATAEAWLLTYWVLSLTLYVVAYNDKERRRRAQRAEIDAQVAEMRGAVDAGSHAAVVDAPFRAPVPA